MTELGRLFRIARQYGGVTIFTSNDGAYSCTITFQTTPGVELKAMSDWGHKEPEQAVSAAIDKANEMMDSIRQLARTVSTGPKDQIEITSGTLYDK